MENILQEIKLQVMSASIHPDYVIVHNDDYSKLLDAIMREKPLQPKIDDTRAAIVEGIGGIEVVLTSNDNFWNKPKVVSNSQQ